MHRLPSMKVQSMLLAGLMAMGSSACTAEHHANEAPAQLDDGWRVSTPEAEGMDGDVLRSLNDRVIEGTIEGIHSILVVKNGAIVHEAYFHSHHRNSLHTLYSITKSVTSGLVGIAIDEGHIADVDESLGTLLPEYASSMKGRPVERVTVQQLLTMQSGLEWDEWSHPYCDPRNSEYPQVRSSDWVKHVLELPMQDTLHPSWQYNTGGVHVLSAVIKSRTGLFADAFAQRHLFDPLGITRYEWNRDPKGYTCTGGTRGGLKLRTRDVAKFGFLFLREGRWKGRQVISERWVRDSTAHHATTNSNTGYGYLWWRASFTLKNRTIEVISGRGYGGQSLAIVPELDLMFVLTCWGRQENADILGPTVMILSAALEDVSRPSDPARTPGER